MSLCPCCGEVLLRHARQNSLYWFCTHCWQEMPSLTLETLEAPLTLEPLNAHLDRLNPSAIDLLMPR